MQRRTKIITAVAAAAVAATGAGIGVASAGGLGDDNEAPITGDALDQATAAALAHTGEGRVTDTEVDDEDSKYEVEVRLDDGTEVDVQLDENFAVVGSENDDPNEADTD